jgi:hypothetical protein
MKHPKRWGTAALAVALLATTATQASANGVSEPVVDQAGTADVIVTAGNLAVGSSGDTSFDLPACPGGAPANVGDECITFDSIVHANGVWVVPVDGIVFPPLQIEAAPGLVVDVQIRPAFAGVGRIEPSTGEGRLSLAIGIGLSLPPLVDCTVGPLVIDLTTGTSGSLTGTAYDSTEGTAKLVNKTFSVQEVTECGLLNAAINGLLGLPLAPGASSATFEILVDPVLTGDGALVTTLPEHGFDDVVPTDFFDNAAKWLKFNNVTTGFGGNTAVFNPSGLVSRYQMALFMYRMMDKPTGLPPHGFNDMPTDGTEPDLAARWLKAEGITTGFGGQTTVFNPDGIVSRFQMSLFLHRLAGKPTGAPAHGFSDMPTDGGQSDLAARWLKANGITTGFAGNTSIFNPDGDVDRGQMAAFLNRLANTRAAWGTSTPPSTLTFG